MSVGAGTDGQAVGLFAITNVDDILILSLFFARGSGEPGLTRRIMVGQYLAFTTALHGGDRPIGGLPSACPLSCGQAV